MPSSISRKTPASTLPITSRIEPTGKLIGPPMTVRQFNRILREFGARPATPEERRQAREAIARTDERIARQRGARKAA